MLQLPPQRLQLRHSGYNDGPQFPRGEAEGSIYVQLPGLEPQCQRFVLDER